MSERPTPETDAFAIKFKSVCGSKAWVPTDICRRFERELAEAREEIKNLQGAYDDATNYYARIIELIDERDEAREKYTALATENMLVVNKLAEERDEALAQVKELIYISDRAIALADIDYENDKFGVVSELRYGLEKIQKAAK